MIYRRPIRDVVEERHGRTCGVHVFLFYIVALSAVLAMSTACLTAAESGYFAFEQEVQVNAIPQSVDATDMSVDYEISYGWKSVCSTAIAMYTDDFGEEQVEDESGCFGLADTELLDYTQATIVGGRAMDADTGLAVALGHAVAAAVAATHILFFSLLYFNIDPAPVRGYLYMRGLGLMAALTSFYLLFTCVVSFFFAIKGSLDINMATSAGLRPSWAYVLTVIDVTLMVVIGMLACQDDEVDAAIATPQYTSSSRDEDTVKLASGKLLHLRSRSSDTVCDNSASQNNANGAVRALTSSMAPKATVGGTPGYSGSSSSAADGGAAAAMGGEHPAATAGLGGLRVGVSGGGDGSGMSAAASSAAAHAAAAASEAFGRLASSPAGSGGSGSVLSSWTGGVSALSPRPRRGDEEEEEEEEEEGGGVQGVGGDGGGGIDSSPLPGSSSGDIIDSALLARARVGEGDGPEDSVGGGAGVGGEGVGRGSTGGEREGVREDERRRSSGASSGASGGAGLVGEDRSSTAATLSAEVVPIEDRAPPQSLPSNVPPTAVGVSAAPAAGAAPAPDAAASQEAAEEQAAAGRGPAFRPATSEEQAAPRTGSLPPFAASGPSPRERVPLPVFSTARTAVSLAEDEDDGEEREDTLGIAGAGSGGLRQEFAHTPPPSARFSPGPRGV